MKQEMKSYLQTIKEDIFTFSKYLHKNYVETASEEKTYNYILSALRQYNFNIKENYLEIPYAFYAEVGYGHPKICFICELDKPKEGYISATNLANAISVAAGLTLSTVVKKVGGAAILIGCPAEYLNNSSPNITTHNAFDDIDAVFMGHPYVVNAETGNPNAALPKEKELLPNHTLSRLFFHNLKECGIIDIAESEPSAQGTGLNLISHIVPCIYPYISVVEDNSVQYASAEFAISTASHFAEDRILKAAEAFALTGLDLIQKENLLNEVKMEFYANINHI